MIYQLYLINFKEIFIDGGIVPKDTDKIIQTKIQAEDYFIKHNPKIYNTKYLVNKTHMVFWNKEGRDNCQYLHHCIQFITDT